MPNHHGNENSANFSGEACHVMPKYRGKLGDIMSNHCGEIDHVFLNHHGREIRHCGDVKNTNMHPYDDDDNDEKLSIKISTSIETFITPEFNYLLTVDDRFTILKCLHV